MSARPPLRPLPAAHSVVYAGLAASCAVIVTNPADVVKTRMQLQGELTRTQPAAGNRGYTGMLDCFARTARIEGVRGLQRGLSTAITREFALNMVRVGLYDTVLKKMTAMAASGDGSGSGNGSGGRSGILPKLGAGLTVGCAGAMVTNPLDILKTRMQAQASGANAAVGHQHGYTGVRDGMVRILREERVGGLYKGLSASMLRLALGSASQLSAYATLKDAALDRGYRDGPALHIAVSFGSVVFGVTAMQPVDVVRTRLYNQPFDERGRGTMYTGPLDALVKVVRHEGAPALFKGWAAHYLRGAPHVALLFVTFEQLKKHQPLQHLSS